MKRFRSLGFRKFRGLGFRKFRELGFRKFRGLGFRKFRGLGFRGSGFFEPQSLGGTRIHKDLLQSSKNKTQKNLKNKSSKMFSLCYFFLSALVVQINGLVV